MPSKQARSSDYFFCKDDYDYAADTRAVAQVLCSSSGFGVSCRCQHLSSQAALYSPFFAGSLRAPTLNGVRMGHRAAQNAIAW